VLFRLPQSWPYLMTVVITMTLLAVLDLAGALAAKEAVARRSLPLGLLGGALFLLLFWVYASSLAYAELAPVTFGWIVVLQVGVLLLDRFRYDVQLPPRAWVAVVVILAAQGYLLTQSGSAPEASGTVPAVQADGPATAPPG
jgi:hypothetical protein